MDRIRILFALNLIVEFIDMNETFSEKEITEHLIFTGFDDYETRQLIAHLGINTSQHNQGFRVFSKEERQILSQEAIHYLEKLFILGLINFSDGEDIIERVLKEDDYNISVETIKEITLMVLLEKQVALYGSSQKDTLFH